MGRRFCYNNAVRPARTGRPLQRGVASTAGGCRGAAVKTGFGPGCVSIVNHMQARPLPMGEGPLATAAFI